MSNRCEWDGPWVFTPEGSTRVVKEARCDQPRMPGSRHRYCPRHSQQRAATWRESRIPGVLAIEDRTAIRAVDPIDPDHVPSGRRVPRILYDDTLEIIRR